MTVYLGTVTSGCTTIVVPGWAAIAAVGVAASPRLARAAVAARTSSEG